MKSYQVVPTVLAVAGLARGQGPWFNGAPSCAVSTTSCRLTLALALPLTLGSSHHVRTCFAVLAAWGYPRLFCYLVPTQATG